ncbi:MAG: tetratricopeptide repeat protein [Anaeromicrobium sp.]|jgi:tetratricopeptide (TPR) repeat protein|uniref:tetratricopeptide repeat protein n=1 Tax=Anaeromicrobium sp. TaxID=1929132 RepID=UPI0025D02633|nr:tetratricopeptide repeat protein [Anaeromicrobium sp.]MCT4595160.1 tetratricopeptide repeat protein [Anaeromicrobium sp.]
MKETSSIDIEIKKIRKRIEFLSNVGKIESVVEEAKNLLSMDPQDKYGLYMLAEAYENLDKMDMAETVILEYLKKYQEDDCAHALYGRILQSKRQFKEAIEEFHRAIDIDPNDPDHYFKLGLCLIGQNEDNLFKSIEILEKSIEIDPQFALGHSFLGILYFFAKRLDDAQREARKAIELDPQHCMPHEQYAIIQYEFGNIHEAQRHVKEILRINPNDKGNQRRLENIEYFKENMQEYLEDRIDMLKDIAKECPKEKKVHLLLAKAYFEIGEEEKSFKEFNKHLKLKEECTNEDLEFMDLLVEKVESSELFLYFTKLKGYNPKNKTLQEYIEKIFEDSDFKEKLKTPLISKVIYVFYTIFKWCIVAKLAIFLYIWITKV